MPRASCFFCGNPATNHFCERCVSTLSESPGAIDAVNDALKPIKLIPLYSEQCACGRKKSTRREHCFPCGNNLRYHQCAGVNGKPCRNRCYKFRTHCWECTKGMKRKAGPTRWVIPETATGAAADCARRLLMEINNRGLR